MGRTKVHRPSAKPWKQLHHLSFSVFSCHLAAAQGCYGARLSNWPGGTAPSKRLCHILTKWRPKEGQKETAREEMECSFGKSSSILAWKSCKFGYSYLCKQISAPSAHMMNTAEKLQLGQFLPLCAWSPPGFIYHSGCCPIQEFYP